MRIEQKHNKSLYYSSGLISLILFPLLCIWDLSSSKVFDQYGAMEINVWSPAFAPNVDSLLSAYPRSINWVKIDLTGIQSEDKIKVDYVQLEIKELMASGDLKTGIRIAFNDTSKYQTWVRVLNICDLENVKGYQLYDNSIWIYNLEPPREVKFPKGFFRSFCGNPGMDERVRIKSPQQIEEEKNAKTKQIKETIRDYFASGLLFFGMVFFTIKRRIKDNKME